MTPEEHYAEADKLIASIEAPYREWPTNEVYPHAGTALRDDILARANTHALLALAPAAAPRVITDPRSRWRRLTDWLRFG